MLPGSPVRAIIVAALVLGSRSLGAQACDTEAYGAWCRALLANGVYPPPSQFEAWFPSLAHTEEHVDRTIEAARAAFAAL